MSFKTFFEKIGTDIKDVFKDLFSVTWEKKVLGVVAYSAPFLEGILAIADPAIAPLVTKIINTITGALNTVQTIAAQGAVVPGSSDAVAIATALGAVKSNMAALLADADIKNSVHAAEITSAGNLVIGEVDAVLGEVPAAPAVSA